MPKFCKNTLLTLHRDSFKYLGIISDRHINPNTLADAVIRPFTAGTFRIKQPVDGLNVALRNMYKSCRCVCKPGLGHPFFTIARRDRGTSRQKINPKQKWLTTLLKRIMMFRDTNPSWCIMRECGLDSILGASMVQLFPGGDVAVQCFNSKQKLHCQKDFTS